MPDEGILSTFSLTLAVLKFLGGKLFATMFYIFIIKGTKRTLILSSKKQTNHKLIIIKGKKTRILLSKEPTNHKLSKEQKGPTNHILKGTKRTSTDIKFKRTKRTLILSSKKQTNHKFIIIKGKKTRILSKEPTKHKLSKKLSEIIKKIMMFAI